jgi:hypothetical protein
VSRKQILFRQEVVRRALERRLKASVNRELKAAGMSAAHSYPEWENAVAMHVLRMGTILEEFYIHALRVSALHMDEAATKAGYDVEVKAKARNADRLGDQMRQWARRESAKKVVEIGRTTRDRIKSAIDKGLKEGLSEDEVAKLIARRTGGSVASSRATTIARTESHGAAQAGGLMAAKDLGVVRTKEWVSAEDERTRETHSEADGQTVGIDDPFNVGDAQLQFPGDPSGPADEVINCRCVMAFGVTAPETTNEDAT